MLLEYNETVPAQEWMSGARVEIFRELQGCAGCGEALGNAPVGAFISKSGWNARIWK